MFDPDIHIDVPTGNLLVEIGIDPAAASEVIAENRALHCAERAAAWPERRFADLVPDLPAERGLCGKAMPAPFLPRPSRRPAR